MKEAPTPEQLLQHEPQLRTLARRLVGDPHAADDLVQETFLSALRRDSFVARPRRWLRETLRLKARQVRDQDRRRLIREQAAAVPDQDPAAEEDERERLAFLRVMSQEVADLEEPYGPVISMRFLEERPPREIARQLGVPVRTVYTRIARGLKLLRSRMDRRYGAGLWMPLFTRLLEQAQPASASTQGNSPTALTAGLRRPALRVALLLAGGVCSLGLFLYLRAGTPDAAATLASKPEEPAPGLTAPASTDQGESDGVGRLAMAAAAQPVASELPAPVVNKGFVRDPAGKPVGGVPVVLQVGPIIADARSMSFYDFELRDTIRLGVSSPEDGSFEIVVPPDQGRIAAVGEIYAPIIAELYPQLRSRDVFQLVVAPRRTVSGFVFDPAGLPIEGVLVRYRPSVEYVGGLRRRERTWMPVLESGNSDVSGYFELSAAYEMEGARLEFAQDGYTNRTVPLPDQSAQIEVTLEPPLTAGTLRGIVVDPAGERIAGAMVFAGASCVMTEADGSFELATQKLEVEPTIWGIAPGHLPARIPIARAADGSFELPERVTLQVGEEPLSIEGIVVDAEDYPVPGARVWCADATPIGPYEKMWFVELHMDPARPGIKRVSQTTSTDNQGRFRIPYLLERDYELGALWPASYVSTRSDPIPAGTRGVVLRLPTDEPIGPLTGRVLNKHGVPMAGAVVSQSLNELFVEIDKHGFRLNLARKSILTDDEGRFLFRAVPRRGLFLKVSGDELMPQNFDIPTTNGPRHVDLVVPQRAHMRVVLKDPAEHATHFALLTKSGGLVNLHPASEYDKLFDVAMMSYAEIEDGRSGLVIGPDTVVFVALYADGEELRRVPVDLSSQELNELEL